MLFIINTFYDYYFFIFVFDRLVKYYRSCELAVMSGGGWMNVGWLDDGCKDSWLVKWLAG